eukprot:TRINITY_DN1130_c0_g1_i1.p1 TRINITY_DN1130_c0_g1~~TRINITY_DN1130_c0_g1_i1.p1  ORF type:complete len:1249 (+),score=175.71 TRINITY_DN1130_c0_g1_i1:191-3937(+)
MCRPNPEIDARRQSEFTFRGADLGTVPGIICAEFQRTASSGRFAGGTQGVQGAQAKHLSSQPKLSRTLSCSNVQKAYLLSKKWHHKWKKYIGAPTRSFMYMNYRADAEEEKSKPREHPGPITNADIIDTDECYQSGEPDDIYSSALKPDMRERFDFKVITKEQWDYLYGKYGGVPLRRERYKPEYYAFYQVESTFQRMNLIVLPPKDEFDVERISQEKPLYASRRWTFQQLRDRIVKILNQPKYGYKLAEGNFRLWKLDSYLNYQNVLTDLRAQVDKIRSAVINNTDPNTEENTGLEFPGVCIDLHDRSKTVERISISPSDRIIIELANEKGEFIFKYVKNMRFGKCEFCYQERPLVVSCKCKEVHYCSTACMKKDERFHEEKCSAADDDADLSRYQKTDKSNLGLTGLVNLGNTCFMNSGLQCLSNTVLLSKYFLEDHYGKEINEDNPLGMKGKMAKSYAKLIKMLWYDSDSVVSPSGFKRVIGKFHSAFSGYSQQDGQELITAVLDALHEDLNRVKKKPYVEYKTTDDPNDNSISVESWYNHLARNQSVIVDLMHGQYKSVVKCPKCEKYSVAFDPFSVISLPVPSPKERIVTFFYVPYDLSKKIIKCSLSVDKKASIEEVREKIAALLNVPKDGSTLVMLSAKTFDRFLCRDQRAKLITKMQSSQLYVQEINPKYFNGPENEGIEKRRKRAMEASLKSVDGESKMETEEKKGTSDSTVAPESLQSPFSPQLYEETKGFASVSRKVDASIQHEAVPVASKVKDHDDYNNGLSDDMLRVCLNIYAKVKYPYWTSFSKERKTFNRLIYIKRSHTMKDLHMEIFKYFRPLFEISFASAKPTSQGDTGAMDGAEEAKSATSNDAELPKIKELSDEKLFAKIFPELEERNWEEKLKPPTEYPYELRLVNIAEKMGYKKEKCFFCENPDCENCLVPFNNDLKVQDLLEKMGSPAQKNDYYYYEHKYYNADKREFELEIVFNEDKNKWGVDLELLEQVELHKDFGESPTSKVSIYNCFDQFSNWETLDQNNLWFCTTCKDSVQASKRMEILKCPPILIVHLKRFKIKETTMMGATGGRLNTLVDFPLENLDLTRYVQAMDMPAIYDLYAVTNHYGSTGFGHYTAFALNQGVWHKFDDSSVFRTDSSQVCSVASYVLFYKRKDIRGDTDLSTLRQAIPEGYRVPEIVAKPAARPTPKNEEEKNHAHEGQQEENKAEEEKNEQHNAIQSTVEEKERLEPAASKHMRSQHFMLIIY